MTTPVLPPTVLDHTFRVKVSVHDEAYSSGRADISISPEFAARIKALSAAVVAVDAYSIESYDYHPEYTFPGYSGDNELLLDASTVVVTKDDFFWNAYLKYASRVTLVETDRIPLELLDEPAGDLVDLRSDEDKEDDDLDIETPGNEIEGD